MSGLRLRAALLLACGLTALSAAPAAGRSTTLTATATFPGVADVQHHRVRLTDQALKGFRVESRPDAATVVLVDHPHRIVRRGHKLVSKPVPPCVRGTLSVGLIPGGEPLLDAVRRLLPEAQAEQYVEERPSRRRGALEGGLATREWTDAGAPHYEQSYSVDEEIDIAARPWSSAGLTGRVTVRMHRQRLRVDDICRDSFASEDVAYTADSLGALEQPWRAVSGG